jgi:hypothetical protein
LKWRGIHGVNNRFRVSDIVVVEGSEDGGRRHASEVVVDEQS